MYMYNMNISQVCKLLSDLTERVNQFFQIEMICDGAASPATASPGGVLPSLSHGSPGGMQLT